MTKTERLQPPFFGNLALSLEFPMFTSGGNIRGLNIFVSDLRNCLSKDTEDARVASEMAKIKGKFANIKSLTGYDSKKYIWKLIYAWMLGYETDLGQIQAVNLCGSAKYSEKVAGYSAVSILLQDKPDILRLVVAPLKADLHSGNELIVSLALKCIGNAGNSDFIEPLLHEVVGLLAPESPSSIFVRRKAIMCVLKLSRKGYRLLSEVWAENLCSFLKESDNGIVLAAASLAIGELERLPLDARVIGWETLTHSAVSTLVRMTTETPVSGFAYYGVACPWLQVRLMRLIQLFPSVALDGSVVVPLIEAIHRILTGVAPTLTNSSGKTSVGATVKAELEKASRLNAEQAVALEAASLAIHLGQRCDRETRWAAATVLGSAVSSKSANFRFLGLELLAKLALSSRREMDPVVQAGEYRMFEKYRSLVTAQLSESDPSLRRQALHVLVAICNQDNWQSIIEELLTILGLCSSGGDQDLQEELTVKIALLAEQNAPDPSWTVDVVYRVLSYAASYVKEGVLARMVQIVTGYEDSSLEAVIGGQSQAAQRAFEALGGHGEPIAGENVMTVSAFILGEFGHRLISSRRVTSLRLVEVIGDVMKKMRNGRPVALNALAKILANDSNNNVLKEEVSSIIEEWTDSADPNVQQTACELAALIKIHYLGGSSVLDRIFQKMPPFKRVGQIAPTVAESSDSEEEGRDPRILWKILCVKSEGPMLENSKGINVSVKMSFDVSKGKGLVEISMSNASPQSMNISGSFTSDTGCKIIDLNKLEEVECNSKGTVTHKLQVELVAPFLAPSKYLITFNRETLLLNLPVVFTKFFSPEKIPADSFISAWQASADSEANVVSSALVDPARFPAYLTGGFNMEVVSLPSQFLTIGIDTVAASATVVLSNGVSQRCMIRVDSDKSKSPANVKISARSSGGRSYSNVLANIVASYFVNPPNQNKVTV